MTNQSVNPPEGWVRTGPDLRAPGDSLRYDVTEADSVPADLAAPSADDAGGRSPLARWTAEGGAIPP